MIIFLFIGNSTQCVMVQHLCSLIFCRSCFPPSEVPDHLTSPLQVHLGDWTRASDLL